MSSKILAFPAKYESNSSIINQQKRNDRRLFSINKSFVYYQDSKNDYLFKK